IRGLCRGLSATASGPTRLSRLSARTRPCADKPRASRKATHVITNESARPTDRVLAADAPRATLTASRGTADREILCDLGAAHGLSDDAQLATRAYRAPAGHVAQWSLEPCPQAARRARALVCATLAAWGRESL